MTNEEISKLQCDQEVCLCIGVNLNEILDAIEKGQDSIEKLIQETEAGIACELCQSVVIDKDKEREIHLDEILRYVKNSDKNTKII